MFMAFSLLLSLLLLLLLLLTLGVGMHGFLRSAGFQNINRIMYMQIDKIPQSFYFYRIDRDGK